jgi:uncharacterized Tic20 family protein
MSQTPNPEQEHSGDDQPSSYQPPSYQPPSYQPPANQPAPPNNPYAGPADPHGAYGYSAGLSQTDRNWAAASHWGTLVAAWLAMGFLAPLLIMLTVGNQSAFVRKHAVESLNFQISLLIYGGVALLFSILTIGLGLLVVIPLALVVLVLALIFLIQASIKAANGEDYRYPLTLRLVS